MGPCRGERSIRRVGQHRRTPSPPRHRPSPRRQQPAAKRDTPPAASRLPATPARGQDLWLSVPSGLHESGQTQEPSRAARASSLLSSTTWWANLLFRCV